MEGIFQPFNKMKDKQKAETKEKKHDDLHVTHSLLKAIALIKIHIILLYTLGHESWKPEYWNQKKLPLLGNGSVNMFQQQQIHTQQVKVKVKVTLRPTTSRSVSPGFKAHVGLTQSMPRLYNKDQQTVKFGH
jgi:hypothetical protein